MARKKDEESGMYFEATPETEVLFQIEDLLIQRVNGPDVSEISITKEMGGISESTYANGASGSQKNWNLTNQTGDIIDVGDQHGNRPFRWIGQLKPGLYTLVTGMSFNYSKRRIPGRGYKVQFRIP